MLIVQLMDPAVNMRLVFTCLRLTAPNLHRLFFLKNRINLFQPKKLNVKSLTVRQAWLNTRQKNIYHYVKCSLGLAERLSIVSVAPWDLLPEYTSTTEYTSPTLPCWTCCPCFLETTKAASCLLHSNQNQRFCCWAKLKCIDFVMSVCFQLICFNLIFGHNEP